MKLTSAFVTPLIPTLSSAAALGRRQNQQGDGPQGDTDANTGLPVPRVDFPIPKEPAVLNETMYIHPGQTFDAPQRSATSAIQRSRNEQDEGTAAAAAAVAAVAVFSLLPGAAIRRVVIGKHPVRRHPRPGLATPGSKTVKSTPISLRLPFSSSLDASLARVGLTWGLYREHDCIAVPRGSTGRSRPDEL